MHNGDVLGHEGRKALDACVKVKIYGKPETRRYDYFTLLERLRSCYAGNYRLGKWLDVNELLRSSFGEHGYQNTYDIVDIRNALVNVDGVVYVEKYPIEGPGSDNLKDLIDKRRADVGREFEEATANPNGRRRYPWIVAQRRVKDCFAGNFPNDEFTVCDPQCINNFSVNFTYSIDKIYQAVVYWDGIKKYAEVQRAAVETEYAEAKNADTADANVQHTLFKYSRSQANSRVMDCIPIGYFDPQRVPVNLDENGIPLEIPSYDIFDIYRTLIQFDGKKLLEKYPGKGPGSEELKKFIDKNRADLEEEYQKATSDTGSKQTQIKYSWSEAERRVRDCFAGTFPGDTEIFPSMKKDGNDQTYDIFDIKDAIVSFDTKTLCDACKYPSKETFISKIFYDESRQRVDEQRASIQSEYKEATSNTEIEHGSGFIVHDHFIITNRHVIETYLDDEKSHEIRISNEVVGELPCEVIHCDAGKDLALLYCPDLNLKKSGICPLQLSSHSLLPGMSIFSFGYPISHTGKTALFVNGNVSGSREMLAGHSMVVLNCSLNSGNSGGPVLCWVKDQLRVVGISTQKHFKEILTLKERETIEHIRKSLQTHAIPDVPRHIEEKCAFTNYYSSSCNHQTPMFLLTLKLYDALETHSQFNLSNALPGHLVVDFIKDSVCKYTGEYKEELAEVIKLSEDPVNILPSGHLCPSQYCVQ